MSILAFPTLGLQFQLETGLTRLSMVTARVSSVWSSHLRLHLVSRVRPYCSNEWKTDYAFSVLC